MTLDGLDEVKGADGKGERVERRSDELAGGRARRIARVSVEGAVRLVRGVVRALAGYPKVPNLFDARCPRLPHDPAEVPLATQARVVRVRG
jgi:hypothetical protein